MTSRDPYNAEVRAYFENPVHAGDLQGEYATMLVADVSESEKGARVVLSAGIDDGMIAEIRFRAWGCPHLIAAAELVCREKENGPADDLDDFSPNGIMQRLSVPGEKIGRIFLLEDALKSIARQHAGTN